MMARRGASWCIECLSSIWLGITVLVLIFMYSAIGSALPVVRQHRWIELTEQGWFDGWPFIALVALLCINLTVVTIRHIRWSWINAGVWTVHCGVLVLCGGSAVYFLARMDGDTLVYRRQARIVVPGVTEAAHLVIRPQNHVTVEGLDGRYDFHIHDIDPEWTPTDSGAGAHAGYRVAIMVTTPRHRFIRNLVDGAPDGGWEQPVSGGAGTSGEERLEPDLHIELGYVPQDSFFLHHTSALYVRESGAVVWHDRPVSDMPLYNDRLSSANDVWSTPDDVPVLDSLDITAPPSPADPLADVGTRVVGYIRQAREVWRWVDGGPELNPVIELDVAHAGLSPRRVTLQLNDPQAARSVDGTVQAAWVESQDELEVAVRRLGGIVTIREPASGAVLELPLAQRGAGAFHDLPGTPCAFRIVEVFDRLTLHEDRTVSMAVVEERTPQGLFTRMVADDPEYGADDRQPGEPQIVMSYQPTTGPPVMLFMGPPPMPLTCVVRDDTRVRQLTAGSGDIITSSAGMTAAVVAVYHKGQHIMRPEVVPRLQRDPNLGRARALMCVALSGAGWTQRTWVPYSEYALPSEQYGVPQRVDYRVREVILPDGREIELLFSRQRRQFGGRVALDEFELLTHPGGSPDQLNTIRDLVSRVRLQAADARAWGPVVTVAPNRPVHHGEWWLFQAAWDPPVRGMGGMNFSGLGVARRRGVHIQLLGAILIAIGATYAFYLKPVLLARRRGRPERNPDANTV